MKVSNLFSRLNAILRSIPTLLHRQRIADVDRLPGELTQKFHVKALSKEEEDFIQDELLGTPKKQLSQSGSSGRLNPVLLDFLARHCVLVEYVKDKYGFKKGLIVAVGKNKVGFSLVSAKDYFWRKVDPMNLPIIQGFRRQGKPLEEVISSRAYCRCIRDGLSVGIPRFDRDYGLLLALGRALECNVGELTNIQQLHLPNDKQLREAAERMLVRAKRYFK